MMSPRRVIRLDDKDAWTFRQASSVPLKWLKVHSMPTNVHLDLIHNGIIPNPHIGKQENDCQWVGEESWVYRGIFLAPDAITDTTDSRVVLALDGLDTCVSQSCKPCMLIAKRRKD